MPEKNTNTINPSTLPEAEYDYNTVNPNTLPEPEPEYYDRRTLARRWQVSTRTIDRLRKKGLLPWDDLSCGTGGRPLVRFRRDVIHRHEQQCHMNPRGHAAA